jgi:phosphoglycolate phosphatase-like HAD superfamily hydrolase
LFDVVTPREKVRNVKPNPEHLEATLKALHIKPEAVMLISNDKQDVTSGRELNVIVVGLSTGSSSEKELTIAGANYLISSISDVPRLIENINKSSRPKRKTSKNRLAD